MSIIYNYENILVMKRLYLRTYFSDSGTHKHLYSSFFLGKTKFHNNRPKWKCFKTNYIAGQLMKHHSKMLTYGILSFLFYNNLWDIVEATLFRKMTSFFMTNSSCIILMNLRYVYLFLWGYEKQIHAKL